MNKTYYTAYYEYWSRGQIRGGIQWSTQTCQQALLDLGFVSKPALAGRPQNALIQRVDFEGTREQIIEQRKIIRQRLMTLSSGRMAMRFCLIRPGEAV